MIEESSFRDPDGFVFTHNGKLYRAVTPNYKENYDLLINSGLFDRLIEKGFLIPHKEIESVNLPVTGMYKILEPEMIKFISYPYEWSFSQLKDAALLTLDIQKTALEFGMSLKDASAYNVQYHKGRPVFIDTLSFEQYTENQPWFAYKQFCQHFLAPIALMSYRDVRLNSLLKNNIEGIPLDLAYKLLPKKTWLKMGTLLHIHLHALTQKKYNSNKVKVADLNRKFSKTAFFRLLINLRETIEHLTWVPKGTEWGDYYEPGVHNLLYSEHKKEIVAQYISLVKPETLWDLGSNNGIYSRIANDNNISITTFDIDPACVENSYKQVKEKKEQNVLPVLIDLVNPSPSLGWANHERKSFTERASVDLIMGLALIHHLAISNNLPFSKIAQYFSELSDHLIIEFVPKEDPKVQIMLKNRLDIFNTYTLEDFEKAFNEYFIIEQKQNVQDSLRTIYLMKRRNRS
jgi:ribosomal protein L11 methylase PrmA